MRLTGVLERRVDVRRVLVEVRRVVGLLLFTFLVRVLGFVYDLFVRVAPRVYTLLVRLVEDSEGEYVFERVRVVDLTVEVLLLGRVYVELRRVVGRV